MNLESMLDSPIYEEENRMLEEVRRKFKFKKNKNYTRL